MVPSAAKCGTSRAEMRCQKWDTKMYSNLELRVTREMTHQRAGCVMTVRVKM